MVTMIGAVLGFFGSMIPEIVGLFRERADRQHELDILQLQLRQQEIGHHERLEEIRVAHDAAQMEALYATYRTHIAWVDALNGTVRPVMAYAFFLLYAAVKAAQCWMAAREGEVLPWLLWGEEDQAIFAAIVSFYFGQRAFGKARR